MNFLHISEFQMSEFSGLYMSFSDRPTIQLQCVGIFENCSFNMLIMQQ